MPIERIEELGIVGAGGGGFPAAVKLNARVSTVIVNAAECEPLLHKDKELLHHHLEPILRGLQTAMELVGARRGIFGIKEKYRELIEAIRERIPPQVSVVPLPDVYPAGDEFILIQMVTGRVVAPGGLPRDVDVVVSNVETLLNVGLDVPVTHKYLTVAGAVKRPMTVRVPIGIAIREVIEAAGGTTIDEAGVLLGGVMMARPATSLDDPVTKTTGGIVVLPASHKLMQRHTASATTIRRIGRSACDQCRFCTEFCPRFLLGHPIEPHRAMQALGFETAPDAAVATLYCCECNLCTMYACPEDLDPKSVCVQAKPLARERGLTFKGDAASFTPHPMGEFRRVPMQRLIARLGLSGFCNEGPLVDHAFHPRQVRILLKQHAGAAALPGVKSGEHVRVGHLLAAPEAGKLGARIHASIDGVVVIEGDAVIIRA